MQTQCACAMLLFMLERFIEEKEPFMSILRVKKGLDTVCASLKIKSHSY